MLKHFRLSPTHIIILSFLGVILIGSVFLALPFSSASGNAVPYLDALFTATTATCVTGLVTLPTATTWSVFGQIVILLLIQIGGLGLITITTGITLVFHRKLKIKDSHLIQEAFNLNTFSNLISFVKKVLLGTLIVECAGALFYLPVFLPKFGAKGIWIAFFNAVSAFCNAGIDIIGLNSLCDYATNPLCNAVTCALIVLGGLGYIVWWDILRVFKTGKRKYFQRLTLHSKIVLSATAILIFGGALLLFLFEYQNPLTLQNYSLFDKIQIALFQSITTRTAGFASLPQENLTNASALVCMLLMFIGGSPAGTAGGVKTVTFVALVATAFSTLRNQSEVSLFGRSLSPQTVKKAVAVLLTSFSILFISTLCLCIAIDVPLIDALYETVSATATVGLSRNVTPFLNEWGKCIIIITMYAGRVGPISLAASFYVKAENTNAVQNPVEEISVG
ncbi:MAG: potassium transporter KtrB [Clostridia bacterium]|nr:potassium transporter KtrB [Clostridia bacterium]